MSKTNIKQRIILASASPRRREILSSMGVDFTVICADADEQSDIKDPPSLTRELALKKGAAVHSMLVNRGEAENTIIISADTVVECGGEILGKPHDEQDALRMIKMLSGRAHTVTTGIAVIVDGKTYTDHSTTQVRVDNIPDSEIRAYIETEKPYDKAGAYGIQGSFSKWISGIDGCYFGVVGLPVNCLCKLFFKATGKYPDQI
ncbi:MAG: septum formation protein Maf [Clostridia bacterium]|nr:septum formation protein Maf [Clostridia bacterium]